MTDPVWKQYRRRPEAGAGHPVILVLTDAKTGEPCPALPDTGAQCATLDRIPFVLAWKKFHEHYEVA